VTLLSRQETLEYDMPPAVNFKSQCLRQLICEMIVGVKLKTRLAPPVAQDLYYSAVPVVHPILSHLEILAQVCWTQLLVLIL
jgi:hypothetical protein